MRRGTYRLVAHRLLPAKDFATVIFVSGPRSISCPAFSPPPVVLYPDSKFFQGCRSYWHCLTIISALTRPPFGSFLGTHWSVFLVFVWFDRFPSLMSVRRVSVPQLNDLLPPRLPLSHTATVDPHGRGYSGSPRGCCHGSNGSEGFLIEFPI